MGLISLLLMALAIGAVCAYVLYTAAQRDNRNPLVWGIVGLLTNIIGVIVYRFAVGPILKP
ncbi:MAG: hypothetical protein M9947_13510 [Thermomicrobiales bacterium]|nr:hypothetical protein [Thermomicrobiales bacterium]